MSAVVPILCINLRDAAERWTHTNREVQRVFPDRKRFPLVRIDGVHWRMLGRGLTDVPLTPLTRLLVTNPQKQATERASHRQMDTPSTLDTVSVFAYKKKPKRNLLAWGRRPRW